MGTRVLYFPMIIHPILSTVVGVQHLSQMTPKYPFPRLFELPVCQKNCF